MANRSYLKSQKLKAVVDASQLLEHKEHRLHEKQDKYLEVRNELFKLQQGSAQKAWLLKKDIENLEKDKREREKKNQVLQNKIEKIRKDHKGNFPLCSVLNCV